MIIAINKPKGPTSFAIVAQIRKITGIKKIGHGGTLDPLASGVLVLAIGREDTKNLPGIVGSEKEYVADIKLGEISETDDAQGPITKNSPAGEISRSEIEKSLPDFIGEIKQIPPQYSAIKINGRRAYKMARAGEKVELTARQVLIKDIEIISYSWPDLKINIICGSGTYIRSLARDLGQRLGCGAYMSDLARTRVGEYGLDKALTIEEFKNFYDQQKSGG